MVLTKNHLDKCFSLQAKIFSKVSSSFRKSSTGKRFLRWDLMSEGLQKGSQLEISDPAETKRDVFHRGCFKKSISKDLVSLQHRIKTSQPHESHRSCRKTQIIPWPALPASLQTAMGQSLGWEGGRKVRKCPAGWGFIGWVWAGRG